MTISGISIGMSYIVTLKYKINDNINSGRFNIFLRTGFIAFVNGVGPDQPGSTLVASW